MSDLATTLEQHARSLRELARALVGASDAEDVVQATAAAVLAHPHPVREPLAFVRHVLRVQAQRHHRGEARRRQREAAHAALHAHDTPPAEHALEHREVVVELHAALMSVPQPHLGALLLRYFEDLTPPAIAERLGVPLPTVKSRLQRGLELLRERLGGGGEARWRERLVRAFGLPAPALVETSSFALPLFALLAMKIAATLFLAATLAVVVWWALPDAAAPPPPVAQVAVGGAAHPSASVADAPAPAPAAREAAPATPSSATKDARVVGRVVTGDRALPGARIDVVPQATLFTDGKPVATTVADAEGRFACDVAAAGEHCVRATAPGHVAMVAQSRVLAPGATLDVGTIALLPGVVVRGRVVDRDDLPVADTPISVNGQWPPAPDGFGWAGNRTTSTADGSFALPPVLPLEQRFWLPREELLAPDAISLAGKTGEVDVLVRVESASRHLQLRGRVVDERGRAVAGARLTVKEKSGATDSGAWFTGASQDDGAFAVRRLRTTPVTPVQLVAVAPGCDETTVPDLAWGRDDVEVVLHPLAAFTVHVVDDRGAPVRDYTLRVGRVGMLYGMLGHRGPFAVHEVRDAAAGTFVVDGTPRGHVDVHVTPIGDGLASSNVLRLEVAPGDHTTIVLPRRCERTARLQFADGAPLAHVQLELCQPCLGEVALDGYVVDLAKWTNVSLPEKALLLLGATTTEQGEMALRGPAATPLALRVLGPGCLPAVVPIERLDGDGPLVVTVRRGGALRVAATPAAVLDELAALCVPGREQPAPSVFLTRPRGRGTERVPPPNAPLVRFDRDGIATLRGVADGVWAPELEFAAERLVLPPVAIRDGETTDTAIDLARLRPATLRGHVLLSGAPAARATVVVERWRGDGESLRGFWVPVGNQQLVLDADGRFVLRTLPGRVHLQLLGADRGDRNAPLAEPNELTLQPAQEVEQTFTITLGTVAVRFVDAQQRPVAAVHAFLRRSDGYFVGHLSASDLDGRAHGRDFEARGLRLTVLPRRLGDPRNAISKLYTDHPDDPKILEHTQLDLGPVTVSTGDPVEQTVVLPDNWFR